MRRVLGPSVLAVFAAVLGACATARPRRASRRRTLDPEFVVAKVDTFVPVIDASLSMGQFTAAGTKLEVARAVGEVLAATVPEVDYRAGVRSFGQGACLPADRTWLLWGMERWDPGAARARSAPSSAPTASAGSTSRSPVRRRTCGRARDGQR